MNRRETHHLRQAAAALLLCAGFVSCSQDRPADKHGELLPAGKYPMEISAKSLQGLTPATRATADNDWSGVSDVAVQVGAEVRLYDVTSADGGATATLSSDNPFWWRRTDEMKTITAWHPYSSAYPAAWTVKADQSSAAAYQASDLIKGELKDLAFADRNDPLKSKMTFSHQTTKVVVNLVAGDGVTLEAGTSVQLLNVSGVETGSTITPYRPDKTRHTYLALLNGQDITAGSPFINVTSRGDTFSYKPSTSKTLKAGTAYTYDITVKAHGIEVTEAAGSEWTSGGSEDIEMFTYKTDLSTARVGDFITASGKLIDKDDLSKFTDAAKRLVVGVVFWTPSETDYTDGKRQTPARLTDDKIMSAEYPACTHGLAVAIKQVTYDGNELIFWQSPGRFEQVGNWQAGDSFIHANKDKFVSVASGTGANDNINRIYGYQNTVVFRAYNAYCTGNGKPDFIVRPVAALDAFKEVNPAPSNSTGWFLPSAKELQILCYKDVDDVYNVYSSSADTRDIVNTSLSTAGGDVLTNDNYWSSSEKEDLSGGSAFSEYLLNANVEYWSKYSKGKVRAVCAF